jgi:hypothetical protein
MRLNWSNNRQGPGDFDNSMTVVTNKYRPRRKVVAGHRSGRLLLLRLAKEGTDQMQRFWLCLCDCGNKVEVREKVLAYANKKSCGCLWRETAAMTARTRATHGAATRGRRTPEYRAWCACRTRCNNPNDKEYHNYGGRGIRVCEEWNNFARFLADVGPRPSLKHTLDRYPDKNGDYEPGNVRWATPIQQGRNTRSNRLLTVDGVTHCLTEWDEIAGLPTGTIRARIYQGWPEDDLLRPRRPSRISAGIKRWQTIQNATKLE